MTTEEKAKAYDEAIERAKSKLHYPDKPCFVDVTEIFPELAEREDERIRKAIKLMYSFLPNKPKYIGDVSVEDMFAWLEKQGEQNPISLEDAAKLFLEKLSESPYNNKPITDAQVITKELINFLKDTNTYNPNAINEQKPAEWNEEDINMFGSILSTLGVCANNPQIPADIRSIHKKEESWFNKLYHRVLPEQEWSEEDEDKLKSIEFYLDDDNAPSELYYWLEDRLKSLKDRVLLQPKQEWSEDDTEMLDYIIRYIEVDKNNDTIRTKKTEVLEGMTEWLKSLKDMCIQQPEQEWSDDDAGFCARIQGILNVCKSHNLLSPDLCKEMCDWLKSLRPQSQWKPTEEQLRELENVFSPDTDSWDEDILRELYEQLKQL